MGTFWTLILLAVFVLVIAGAWKTLTKAGQPGWAIIIPIYNYYILTKVGGLEIMWFIFIFIPILNIVAFFKINIAIAEKFGQSVGFGIGLALLGFIFYPILGFGSATYKGAAAAPPAPSGQAPPEEPATPQAPPAQGAGGSQPAAPPNPPAGGPEQKT